MFWPLILPFQITCCILLIALIALTAFASPKNWGRGKTFSLYFFIALIAFIPSCTGIMIVVDAIRFGDFSYASYSDIPDFRSRRYLPEKATDIEMRKHTNGYYARYKLSTDEFSLYLEDIWKKYGEYSAVERGGFSDEGKLVDPQMFKRTFKKLGWNCPSEAIVYYSPREGDGGGATYYVCSGSELVYQRTDFW